MRPIKYLFAVVVLVAIVAAVCLWRMPADVGYRYGARLLGPLALSGIGGTIWDGHADGVSLFGQDLGELDWHARKQPLLGRELVADVRIKGTEIDFAGELTRRADGSVSARGMRFSIPASRIEPLLGRPDLQLLGTISGVLDDATLMTASISNAKGSARWSGVGASGEVEAHFTDLLFEFASQPDGTVGGSVRDDGNGNIAVDGRFSLRVPVISGEATLRARDGDPATIEMLQRLGEPQADGSVRVVVQGRAAPWL